MRTVFRFVTSFLTVGFLVGAVYAQEKAAIPQPAPPSVTVTATTESVRFTAPGETRQLRLEVFAAGQEKVFDSEAVSGHTLDWNYSDQQGQRVPDGEYRYALFVKDTTDELRTQRGVITLRGGEATVSRDTEPVPLANQVVDGDIVFTSPGQSTYARDIRLSDNFGGLRFIGADSLTTTPAGAAIQFFGNNASPFNGQLYLDSGALNSAALIFRTAQTGGTISERMRVTAGGQVAIGKITPFGQLDVESSGGITVRALNVGRGTGVSGASLGDGSGVLGFSTVGNGVRGEVNNTTVGAGVFGLSSATDGNGVIGEANAGANAYGVWGRSTSGLAGRFSGNVQITGNLSKGSGSFKIDHPLDPANRYLSHSFVESPDMMNIYNGNVTTNAAGDATVEMPKWFDALNKDFRYQLAVIGQFAQAMVATKIEGNRFTIKTDKPNVEVSWQVTGIRRDAYAEKHRVPVEEDKPDAERGSYIHPEVFGQPAEKGVDWVLKPELMRQKKDERSKSPQQQQPETPRP